MNHVTIPVLRFTAKFTAYIIITVKTILPNINSFLVLLPCSHSYKVVLQFLNTLCFQYNVVRDFEAKLLKLNHACSHQPVKGTAKGRRLVNMKVTGEMP